TGAGCARPPAPAPAASAPAPRWALLDAALVGVGLDVIRRSDVLLACDLVRVREAPGLVDPDGLGPCPPAMFDETVEQLVNQTLILEDAERFNLDVPAEALEARLAALEAKVGGPEGLARLLARHGATPQTLRERLARELLLGLYLERRIGLLVVVAPDEVEAYYRANRAEFGGLDLAAVAPRIRAYLERVKYRDALADYLETLRARAEIRRLSPLEAAP
ncbi:MAG TPA: hypothetical protein VNM66_08515, partial [Thermodesulfobacteriota bacterium]|nr:hypothetical protein [Thermodesulfobacteriota bacterium]